MAAPMTSENMSNPNSDEESDEMNFLSPNFNPLKALYSSQVQLPFPKATIFNNLREYEWITSTKSRSGSASGGQGNEAGGSRRGLSSSRARKQQVQIPLGRGFRATKEMLIDTARKKQTTVRNVLTRMSELSSGPLSMLCRCMNERCKVRVCTRSFKGLRGVCTGYLVTFDKFFNMALVDVDEVWRRPSTGQRFYHEEKLTFCKIMECARPPVPKDLLRKEDSRTVPTKEGDRSREEGRTSDKGPQADGKHRRAGAAKESQAKAELEDRGHSGKRSATACQRGDGQYSERRDLRRHRPKDEAAEVSRRRTEVKSSHEAPEKEDRNKPRESDPGADDTDEDIEDLQQRLAALQRELTSLSDDDVGAEQRSPKTDMMAEGGGVADRWLTALYKDLNSSSDSEGCAQATKGMDEIVEEPKTNSGGTLSRDSVRTAESTARLTFKQGSSVLVEESTEVEVQESGQGVQDKGDMYSCQKDLTTCETTEQLMHAKGGISKLKQSASKASTAGASTKQGRLKIRAEDFQRRHVNQLFIRGDNVVLVSVDSVLLPK